VGTWGYKPHLNESLLHGHKGGWKDKRKGVVMWREILHSPWSVVSGFDQWSQHFHVDK
jgi:hypothetical protein